eukprot:296770-Chlamydomonas_euryale.AAC.5
MQSDQGTHRIGVTGVVDHSDQSSTRSPTYSYSQDKTGGSSTGSKQLARPPNRPKPQLTPRPPGQRVPQPHALVVAAADQQLPAAGVRHARDRLQGFQGLRFSVWGWGSGLSVADQQLPAAGGRHPRDRLQGVQGLRFRVWGWGSGLSVADQQLPAAGGRHPRDRLQG